MILPTIHLNGTSKSRLVESLCDASAAIEAAYRSLKQTAPNGRDYYPQGEKALEQATAEHFARLQKLDDVKQEVDRLTLAINEIN